MLLRYLRYLQPRAARPARVVGAVRQAVADAAVLEAVGAAGRAAVEAVAVAVVVPAAAVGVTDAAAIAVDVAGLGRIAGKGASSSRT